MVCSVRQGKYVHMVPVQIIPYVPTLTTCISAQIHLGCGQIYENRFLIRALVSLIFVIFR